MRRRVNVSDENKSERKPVVVPALAGLALKEFKENISFFLRQLKHNPALYNTVEPYINLLELLFDFIQSRKHKRVSMILDIDPRLLFKIGNRNLSPLQYVLESKEFAIFETMKPYIEAIDSDRSISSQQVAHVEKFSYRDALPECLSGVAVKYGAIGCDVGAGSGLLGIFAYYIYHIATHFSEEIANLQYFFDGDPTHLLLGLLTALVYWIVIPLVTTGGGAFTGSLLGVLVGSLEQLIDAYHYRNAQNAALDWLGHPQSGLQSSAQVYARLLESKDSQGEEKSVSENPSLEKPKEHVIDLATLQHEEKKQEALNDVNDAEDEIRRAFSFSARRARL